MTRMYPDISDIIERKRLGRAVAAKRSFADKIAWLEQAREELRPFASLRAERRRGQRAGATTPIKRLEA